jgi:hypothetical protein
VNSDNLAGRRKIIFFDLDLFLPSRFAYLEVRDFLLPGDILYFDQARDQEEQRLINDYVLPEINVSVIASSYSNIAFLCE